MSPGSPPLVRVALTVRILNGGLASGGCDSQVSPAGCAPLASFALTLTGQAVGMLDAPKFGLSPDHPGDVDPVVKTPP